MRRYLCSNVSGTRASTQPAKLGSFMRIRFVYANKLSPFMRVSKGRPPFRRLATIIPSNSSIEFNDLSRDHPTPVVYC